MNEQTQIKSKSDDDDWSGTFTACCIISGAIGSVIYGVVGALIGHSASHEPPVNLNTAINSAAIGAITGIGITFGLVLFLCCRCEKLTNIQSLLLFSTFMCIADTIAASAGVAIASDNVMTGGTGIGTAAGAFIGVPLGVFTAVGVCETVKSVSGTVKSASVRLFENGKSCFFKNPREEISEENTDEEAYGLQPINEKNNM